MTKWEIDGLTGWDVMGRLSMFILMIILGCLYAWLIGA